MYAYVFTYTKVRSQTRERGHARPLCQVFLVLVQQFGCLRCLPARLQRPACPEKKSRRRRPTDGRPCFRFAQSLRVSCLGAAKKNVRNWSTRQTQVAAAAVTGDKREKEIVSPFSPHHDK
jgi:hypothetical protein